MSSARRPRQLDLPSLGLNPLRSDRKITYSSIPVGRSTFKAGLAARVHRWFRLTPSFGPDLVQEMLSTLKCSSDDIVLDPFAGAGTTLIECQLEGLTSYGFEINPFLAFVCDTSLNWDLDSAALREALSSICREFVQLKTRLTLDNLHDHGLTIPKIHNPTRWWRPDVLLDLVALKAVIDSVAVGKPINAFFRLGLAGILVPDVTNVTLGRLQLHFIDRSRDAIEVLDLFQRHCLVMISDLESIRDAGVTRTSAVIYADSTRVSDVRLNGQPSCVITSPPYPNRYSYVWNTRPHLYLLDFLSTARGASDLDERTIGGTWGTATSNLLKGEIEPKYSVIERVIVPVARSIRQVDNLMANYLVKYFNLLTDQIVAMDSVLRADARVAYVVGCSRLKGIFVETDALLGQIFDGLNLGYKVSRVERIRKRHSGKNLYESIVYAWKER